MRAMVRKCSVFLLAVIISATLAREAREAIAAAPNQVYPAREQGFTQSLNGKWSFKYIPSLDAGADEGFHAPAVDVSAWKTISVPANWELQGFAEPQYAGKLKDGTGLYRRTFRVPGDWQAGRRMFIRFEGVAYGFKLWVNGKEVGTSQASAYNPHTFDITDYVLADADNVLAVRVSTKPLGYRFDVYDDWSLSGIYRDVTLFSVPAVHIADFTTSTKIADDGAATLSVAVTLNKPSGQVRGSLVGPDGKTVNEFDVPPAPNGRHEAVVRVTNPQLWTAETPSLYRLRLTLLDQGKASQTIDERIGLREVSIVDGVLCLNGRPIKLRGVNHHDLAPETGRAITEEEMWRDLELMRKANVNFVRTAHYPPNKRFIELCDELGFYVMDEVSLGNTGQRHLNDPEYRQSILARVEPTITRDKNRPSVIIWSIGNENWFNDTENEAGRLAKDLDPTRPICFPKRGDHFSKDYERTPDFADVYAPHYPTNSVLRGYVEKLKRPAILTEYAHSLGLATDRIQDQWEIMQTSPRFAGGAIWHFHDQGILRTRKTPVDRTKPTDSVWLDEHHLYDTNGNDGSDGLVYSDRTPQSDFWQTRKVYAAVQIAEGSAAVKTGAQQVTVNIENRYDFRSLRGMKIAWSLRRNNVKVEKGEVALRAASREKETLRIPVNIPGDTSEDVLALELRCLEDSGLQITERTVRLDLVSANREAWVDVLAKADKLKLTENETEVKIEHPRWVLTVSRPSGELTLRDRTGHVLVAGVYPHPGRKLTITEGRSAGKYNTWRSSTLTEVTSPHIKVTQNEKAVRLAVSGCYPRPQVKIEPEKERSNEPLDQLDKPVEQEVSAGESFVGGYQAEIMPNGAIKISYDYAPTSAKGKFSEAGLSIVLPEEMTEFRWIGQGLFAGYPGKDRLNEFGIYHLNREDLRFEGNRRETELALLTTPTGAGVALVTAAADVAVERHGGKTLLSHNVIMSGLGNKGVPPETFIDADKTPRIAGSFTLVPLDENWPAALTRWFGKPAAAREAFRPYWHSYDQ